MEAKYFEDSKDNKVVARYLTYDGKRIDLPLEPTPCSMESRERLAKRSEQMELLEKYSIWLEEHGYLDTDWRSEEPFAIDEFVKTFAGK